MQETIISEVGGVFGPPTDGSGPIVFTCCCPRVFSAFACSCQKGNALREFCCHLGSIAGGDLLRFF